MRRRLEAEKQQASAYAAAGSRATCWRSRTISTARWPRSATSFAADKIASQFLAGIEATARELERGVRAATASRRIAVGGEPLDPHRHQAMIEMPTDDAEPGTIVEEMQAGYMLKDRLLRPGAGRGGEEAGLMHFAVVGLALGGEAEPRLRLA